VRDKGDFERTNFFNRPTLGDGTARRDSSSSSGWLGRRAAHAKVVDGAHQAGAEQSCRHTRLTSTRAVSGWFGMRPANWASSKRPLWETEHVMLAGMHSEYLWKTPGSARGTRSPGCLMSPRSSNPSCRQSFSASSTPIASGSGRPFVVDFFELSLRCRRRSRRFAAHRVNEKTFSVSSPFERLLSSQPPCRQRLLLAQLGELRFSSARRAAGVCLPCKIGRSRAPRQRQRIAADAVHRGDIGAEKSFGAREHSRRARNSRAWKTDQTCDRGSEHKRPSCQEPRG
jgi:hypothetical protein